MSIRKYNLFCRAFLKTMSTATREGMVSVMSCRTRSVSSQAMSPNRPLNALRMLESRPSSASDT